MTTLYNIVYSWIISIMQVAPGTSSAAELVSICITLPLTFFIVLAPLSWFVVLLWRKKKHG
ncbi:MAG: hypothetical protein IJY94_02405 [Clostridia bacterium]|nr:hypothetical protein [Clostridia bacterium]